MKRKFLNRVIVYISEPDSENYGPHRSKDVMERANLLLAVPDLLTAARALIAYRDAAGPFGFQLEKADDFINTLRGAVAKAEGWEG